MATKSFPASISALVLLPMFAGCAGDDFPLAPVSGTLMLDGRPVANAQVAFEPQRLGDAINAGPGSYGTTNAQGQFELRTADGRAGAVIGAHAVIFSTYQAKQGENFEMIVVAEELIPQGYRTGPGRLTFTVPAEGTTHADFQLSSTGPN
ncbi:MAG: hypothetical protein KDA42_03005 [Planctomycetales bacterium]|nr:hypothetical protein [Planctomycetales bacterium]